MMCTQGLRDYDWIYSLKIPVLAHFRSKVLEDFPHYVTQINCLTVAIISDTYIRHILRMNIFNDYTILHKTLILNVLWLFYDLLSLKTDVSVPTESNKHLESHWRKIGIWIRKPVYGSEDPDPYQNVTDLDSGDASLMSYCHCNFLRCKDNFYKRILPNFYVTLKYMAGFSLAKFLTPIGWRIALRLYSWDLQIQLQHEFTYWWKPLRVMQRYWDNVLQQSNM